MAMDHSVLLDNIKTEENDVNFADGLRDQSWVPECGETSSNREREATRSAAPEKEEVWQSFPGGEAPVSSLPGREAPASFLAREATASFPGTEAPMSLFPAREATASFPAREATASFPAREATASFPAREATASFPAREATTSFTGGEAPVSSFPAREVTASAGTERKESQMAGPASQGFFNPGNYRPTPAVGHRGLQPQQTPAPRYGVNAWPNPAGEQPLTAGLNEAMRHYAMGTSPSSLEMGEVAHSSSYPVVVQPASGPGPWTGEGMSPAERPSSGSLVLTIIGAVLSLWCCVCTGIAAVVVSVEAWQMQSERKYKEAKENRGCAWILIVISIFIAAPTIVILALTHHVPGTV